MLPAEQTMLRFEAACIALGQCRQDLTTPGQQAVYNEMMGWLSDLWSLVERELPMDAQEALRVYNFQPSDYYFDDGNASQTR